MRVPISGLARMSSREGSLPCCCLKAASNCFNCCLRSDIARQERGSRVGRLDEEIRRRRGESDSLFPLELRRRAARGGSTALYAHTPSLLLSPPPPSPSPSSSLVVSPTPDSTRLDSTRLAQPSAAAPVSGYHVDSYTPATRVQVTDPRASTRSVTRAIGLATSTRHCRPTRQPTASALARSTGSPCWDTSLLTRLSASLSSPLPTSLALCASLGPTPRRRGTTSDDG